MITLDKIQLLEERIRKAVALINRLREENNSLSEQVSILKMHNEELKDFAKNYNQDNDLIERGIASSLSHLDQIEGLNDEIPVEDLNRSKEFAEFDTSSAQSQQFDERVAENAETILNYEEEAEPLV